MTLPPRPRFQCISLYAIWSFWYWNVWFPYRAQWWNSFLKEILKLWNLKLKKKETTTSVLQKLHHYRSSILKKKKRISRCAPIDRKMNFEKFRMKSCKKSSPYVYYCSALQSQIFMLRKMKKAEIFNQNFRNPQATITWIQSIWADNWKKGSLKTWTSVIQM